MQKKKTMFLVTIVAVVLLLVVGVSLAVFSFNQTGTNSNLVLGDIYMHYNETNQIDLSNVLPTSTYDESKYFEFTIRGKNTYEKETIYYEILLNHGSDHETRTERIKDSALKFTLVEIKDNVETVVIDGMKYDEINNSKLWVNTIPANTTNELNVTYRLYMWISDEDVIIGNTSQADYDMDTWNNQVYASIKVNVKGDFEEKENYQLLSNVVKSKLGSEGVVAVNTEGTLYDSSDSSQTIREYRYSGIGNYCTYTDGTNDYNINVEGETCPLKACKIDSKYESGTVAFNNENDIWVYDGDLMGDDYGCTDMGGTEIGLKTEGSTPTDSGLRNYVEFNGELWRIIGVFGDNVKIVKDTPLANDIYTETYYTSGETNYHLKFAPEGIKYGYFHYRFLDSDDIYSSRNDWTTSGVMHYLNDETGNSYYVNHLSTEAKNMIQEETYYLGNVSVYENDDGDYTIRGMASEVYNQERGSVVCDSSVTYNAHESNCNIWNENQDSWEGKVSLLYPSDYAYASASDNWGKDVGYYHTNGGSVNNWLWNTDVANSCFLSPASDDVRSITRVTMDGSLGNNHAGFGACAVRPRLNLKSEVMMISGEGSLKNPYKLQVIRTIKFS